MSNNKKKYALKTYSKKLLADTLTPVSVYLRLRDKFPNSLLLESSDYRANDNSFSYICSNPIASIEVKNNTITTHFPDGESNQTKIDSNCNVSKEIEILFSIININNLIRIFFYYIFLPLYFMASSSEDVYDVEAIIDDRIHNGKKQYLIKWMGYGMKDSTWEYEQNIFCTELKRKYEGSKKEKKVSKENKKDKKKPKYNAVVTNEWANMIEKVLGVQQALGGRLEVEYLTYDGKKGVCDVEEMHAKAPGALLHFYESHLTFT